MNKKSLINRRHFINQSALASGAFIFPMDILAENLFPKKQLIKENLDIYIFSKHLQFLNYKDMCESSKEMGFDGIDLTVRPKGHVLPENVTEDLPKATAQMIAFGLSPKMLSTNIISSEDPIQKKVLETAKNLGYEYYRTAWLKYDTNTEILENIRNAKTKLQELASLNKELGLKGTYHNHSGNYIGSAIWDLQKVLKDIPPNHLGCQYDIMHATVEGGKNWEIGFHLIKPYINSLVIKDFKWGKVANKWKPIFTPLGEGMVDFNKYFSLLKQNNINVPISLHVEYDLGGAEHGNNPTINKNEVFRRIQKDLEFIRIKWQEVNN